MIPVENITDWRGQDVIDAVGEKLGKLEQVYFDGETDEPDFAAVKSGRLARASPSCRWRDASVGRDYVRVDRAKGEFKKAPSFDTDVELTLDDEAATYRHYGLEYTPAGEGARRLPSATAPDRDEARADRGELARGDQPLLLVAQRRVERPAVEVGAGDGLAEVEPRRELRADAGRPGTGARASRRRGGRVLGVVAVEQPPGRGALVEAVDVELVDDEPGAVAQDLGEAAQRLAERDDVVQREHRDGGVERARRGVEVASASWQDAVAALGSIAVTS